MRRGQFAAADNWRILRFVRLPRVGELHRTLQQIILQVVVVLPQLTSYVHLVQLVLGIAIVGPWHFPRICPLFRSLSRIFAHPCTILLLLGQATYWRASSTSWETQTWTS